MRFILYRITKVFLIRLAFFSFTLIIVPYNLNAQTFDLSSADLSTIKVDEISDAQIQQALSKAQAGGYTQQQIEAAALAKGMPQSEIAKLRDRMNKIQTTGVSIGKQTSTERSRTDEDIFKGPVTTTTPDARSNIFGYSIFNSENLSFEPSVNVPTPVDYQLGPGDKLIIDIWGASQQNYQLTVSPDGYIVIDNIGPIAVNGLTIENATSMLISRLSSIYSGLKSPNPNTFAQVSLGNLRSIKVILMGEVYLPGSYKLSSLSTAFNALYLSGGPNINGSLRNIDIVRNNKIIANLDVYDFLLKGDKSIDLRLNDQDIIKVNPYTTRVNLTGAVKRPAIYELKPSEKLSDLIAFAGGFTDGAYTNRIKVYRNTSREKQLLDVPSADFSQFSLQNGDDIVVGPILPRFENRVTIRGALWRPGEYSLDENLSLLKLIDKAEGLREDAFLSRTLIYRLREDLSTEVIPVDLSGLIAGKTPDVSLKREDIVEIPSIFSLQEEFFLQIDGAVQNPGKFPFRYNSSLQDVIIMAGGLSESASLARIEIARRVKDSYATAPSIKIADIFTFQISKDLRLSDSASSFKLEPFDRIFIRRSPGYEVQVTARVEGEVIFPGSFSISSKAERISHLVNRSGGLTPEAFPKGARLIRRFTIDEKERLKALENINLQSGDSLLAGTLSTSRDQAIGIDLVKILAQPGSKYDLLLQEGDVLKIPKQLQTVRLSGALLYPITVRYDKRYSFRNYIDNAGGYTDEAKPSKSYVLYANGSVNRTRSLFTIKNYPKIEPGAEIVIPVKAQKQKMSSAEALSFGTAMASVAMILVTIIKTINP
jgi:protein involved in polysaccharide export with SLBB domain